ncbi:hypothetical protein FRD01_14225 [Microvenator marinus]|uniref:VIT domain-containing protein n=1 Tax=Microvenator marinus TaxID=2600177 RepID=A0A5B8XTD7_9DELT|nr:VIT domain-containing protein [Microvenator marinus]QED28367.1 hypothetical protein FRD01_14225 [Microvenator marinus]
MHPITFIVLFAALLYPPFAQADWLDSTLGQPVHEASHHVTLSLNEGIATYKVQRTFANTGEIPDEAVMLVNLPEGAAASGLRIRAGKVWYEGELLKRDVAARRYEELTGMGVADLRDPALLAWSSTDTLELHVFPVPAMGTATLEYTLVAPAKWDDGEWLIDYAPSDDAENLAPITLSVECEKCSVEVEGRLVGAFGPTALGHGPEAERQIRITPPNELAMYFGTTRFAALSATHAYHQVAVPKRLSDSPVAPKVVFLVDASYSVGARGIQTQIEWILSIASHMPDGLFKLVEVGREIYDVTQTYYSLPELQELLATWTADLTNGSNLDLGLEYARFALKDESPAYIFAFTDDYLKRAINTEKLPVKSEITTQILLIGESWGRQDEHRLAQVSKATGGILVGMGSVADAETYAEHLVRPIMLEDVNIEDIPMETNILMEGESHRFFGRLDTPVTGILSAKLWHDEVKLSPRRHVDLDRATAGWMFSHDEYHHLSEKEQIRLAFAAGVVSPHTSYLAIEPGVRPSKQGIDRGMGMGGFGASGVGYGSSGLAIGRSSTHERPDFFSKIVGSCAAAFPGENGKIEVHTTIHEIVDVIVQSPENQYTQCVSEDVWATRLPTSAVETYAVYRL